MVKKAERGIFPSDPTFQLKNKTVWDECGIVVSTFGNTTSLYRHLKKLSFMRNKLLSTVNTPESNNSLHLKKRLNKLITNSKPYEMIS